MEKELQSILKTMDVPAFRTTDNKWLLRNLAVRNKEHPQFKRAMEIIVSLLSAKNQIKASEAKKILQGG